MKIKIFALIFSVSFCIMTWVAAKFTGLRHDDLAHAALAYLVAYFYLDAIQNER